MRCLMLLTLPLLLVVVEADRHRSGYNRPPSAANRCSGLLMSAAAQQAYLTATSDCIEQTSGLQAILDRLNAACSSGRENRHDGRGGRDPLALLEAGNYITEATELKMCIADELGFLSGTDFNVTAFKDSLLAKVTGTASLANTQLGLDSCPEAPLVAFDIKTYMQCIMTWCATGAAPA